MAVKGFNVGGNIHQYDVNSLANITEVTDRLDDLEADVSTLNTGYTNLALQIDRILEAVSVPTTATSYSCAWSSYDLLLIQSCQYSNVRETALVTKVYFNSTSDSTRVQLYDHQSGDRIYEVYKNGTSAVYVAITTGSAGTAALNLKIYGIKFVK